MYTVLIGSSMRCMLEEQDECRGGRRERGGCDPLVYMFTNCLFFFFRVGLVNFAPIRPTRSSGESLTRY